MAAIKPPRRPGESVAEYQQRLTAMGIGGVVRPKGRGRAAGRGKRDKTPSNVRVDDDPRRGSVDPDRNPKAQGPGISEMSPRAKQAYMKRLGYRISVDGIWGPQSKAAWNNLQSAKRQGIDLRRAARYWSGSSPRANKVAQAAPAPKAKAAPKPKAAPARTPQSAALRTIGFPEPRPLSPSMLDYGKPIDPRSLDYGEGFDEKKDAETLADLQYDAELRDLGIERVRQPIQARQNLADIRGFYQQVDTAVEQAAARDAEINRAGQASMSDANRAVLSSLGGEANPAAGVVGSAGQMALGTLSALGTAQEQYNEDVQPLRAAEGAAASTREMAEQTRLGQDIAERIRTAMGQKGSAEAAARLDLRDRNNALAAAETEGRIGAQQYNNQLRGQRTAGLLGIRQYNDQQGQQDFQNELAMEQLSQAALLNGVKIADLLKPAPKAKAKPVTSQDLVGAAGDSFATVMEQDANGRMVMRPELRGNQQAIVAAVFDAYRARGLNPYGDRRIAASATAVLRRMGINAPPTWFGLGGKKKKKARK